MIWKKCAVEMIGTSWLVFGGCGSAVLAAAFPNVGIGFLGVALAFGLTVLTMAFSIGAVSGCHLNPAVTIGLAVARKHPKSGILPYVIAQIIGGIIGAGILYLIASGKMDSDPLASGFASNGYGEHSPGGYSLLAGFITEFVATGFFLFVILSSTDRKASVAFAPIAIGLTLTLIHLVTIPVTNTSVNPARSLATAVFVGGWALQQLWMFCVAPILGAIAGAVAYKMTVAD
ncbi:MAG: aquaporin Z [Oligoflexia bacterium]|nr:aquaporin Z [Oligoflexia bacterium]